MLAIHNKIMDKIYLVAEHCGQELKKYLISKAKKYGIKVIDLYPIHNPDDDYPMVAKILAKRLEEEKDAIGIAICGSGQGINMSLNRFYFIRSALVTSEELAWQARQHSDANVISLGSSYTKKSKGWKYLRVFLETRANDSERHIRRREQISQQDYTSL
jgi:ribose 5-phosphate isomerase B